MRAMRLLCLRLHVARAPAGAPRGAGSTRRVSPRRCRPLPSAAACISSRGRRAALRPRSQRKLAGWLQPSTSASRSTLVALAMSADASSWWSSSARWYTSAMSDAHRPRCLIAALLASPSLSRRSVAPPIRQHFPPKSAGSSPHAAAIFFATRRDVADVHGDVPSSSVKNGTRLVPPGLRCAAGTSASLASHAALSAS
eukprot:2546567-Pleurochrysis_carterae.AAC.1